VNGARHGATSNSVERRYSLHRAHADHPLVIVRRRICKFDGSEFACKRAPCASEQLRPGHVLVCGQDGHVPPHSPRLSPTAAPVQESAAHADDGYPALSRPCKMSAFSKRSERAFSGYLRPVQMTPYGLYVLMY
jgi:hypothetical protein